MRPLRRGPGRVVGPYQSARPALEAAIGDYCSYCEAPGGELIEHVLPWENKHTSLKLDWENLLFSCATCNNNKARHQDATPYDDPAVARARYLWPDTGDTHLAFQYDPSGKVGVTSSLGEGERALAEATHRMLNLGGIGDSRWTKRDNAWLLANRARQHLIACDTPEMRAQIEDTARNAGFWSVWRVIFADDIDMLKRLNAVFPTDSGAFDASTMLPTPRARGERSPP